MTDKAIVRALRERVAALEAELSKLAGQRRTGGLDYRLAVENANEAVVVTQEGRFRYVNAKAVQISGYSRQELLNRPFTDFVHPDDRSRVLRQRAYPPDRRHPARPFALRLVARDGRVRWLECQSIRIYWEQQTAVLSFLSDVTVRQQAQDRIRSLSQQLIRAQEKERQNISCYLHDRVAQDLSSLLIAARTLLEDEPAVSDATRGRVDRMCEVLHQCIEAVRNLAYDLRPPVMEQLGLAPTIYQYCEDFTRATGICVDFTSAGMDGLDLAAETEINLYRLVQEGLNNIRKHSGASRVSVKLIASSPNIILRIEDNGRGFDVEEQLIKASEDRRMGLGGMVERVSLLKGRLRIDSRLERGTRIFAEVPIG
jgi:PAS domain S-box-containing protein